MKNNQSKILAAKSKFFAINSSVIMYLVLKELVEQTVKLLRVFVLLFKVWLANPSQLITNGAPAIM